MARTHTESAIKTLAGIMTQPGANPSARVAAAEALLDRGWGKPAQMVVGPGDDGEHIIKVAWLPTIE